MRKKNDVETGVEEAKKVTSEDVNNTDELNSDSDVTTDSVDTTIVDKDITNINNEDDDDEDADDDDDEDDDDDDDVGDTDVITDKAKKRKKKKKKNKLLTKLNNLTPAQNERLISKIIVFALLVSLIVYSGSMLYEKDLYKANYPAEYTYAEFEEYLANGEIACVYTSDLYVTNFGMGYLRFIFINEKTAEFTRDDFESAGTSTFKKEDWGIVNFIDTDEYRELLYSANVPIVIHTFSEPTMDIFSMVSVFIEFAFLIFMSKILFKSLSALTLNNDDVELYDAKKLKHTVSFNDVIGHDEVIKDLRVIQYLYTNEKKGKKIGASLPNGLLFTGEPGTGKTLLAQAMASEMNVNFIYANASSFIELYVGMGARRVRKVFSTAKKNSPCIIFIDEIDAIGGARSGSESNSERQQTINALLQELDGFEHRNDILVIAATNMADMLDPALTRSGRFDRRIDVHPPKDWHVRKQLVDYYIKKKAVESNLDVDAIAKKTVGFTGADIKALANEAALTAVANDHKKITNEDFQIALEKKMLHGNRRTEEQEANAKLFCAYHEAGHALLTYLTKTPIVQVSIIQTTSGYGGYVMHGERETTLYSKSDIIGRIKIAFGGRVGERLHFGNDGVTVGATEDFKTATALIKSYVCTYGFDHELGAIVPDDSDDKVKLRIRELAKQFEDEAYAELEKYKDAHEAFAKYLCDAEIVSGKDAETFFAKYINVETNKE